MKKKSYEYNKYTLTMLIYKLSTILYNDKVYHGIDLKAENSKVKNRNLV